MLVYKRNITTKLLLLRLSFIITISLCVYFFTHSLETYGYLLSVVVLFCSIIPVTGLTIYNNSFFTTHYYFYAFIPRRWKFQKGENIEVYPFDIELSDSGYLGSGEWWDIFFIFFPPSSMTFEKFIIKHTDIIDNVKRIKMKLSQKEYEILNQFLVK